MAWAFGFEEYDSMMINVAERIKCYEKDTLFKAYCNSLDGIDFRRGSGISSFLGHFDASRARSIPARDNNMIDFPYMQRKLEVGLKELGCKTVFVFLGPREVTYKARTSKKGLFGWKDTPYEAKKPYISGWCIWIGDVESWVATC